MADDATGPGPLPAVHQHSGPPGRRVAVENAEFRVGPEHGDELGLATTRFEAVRWRLVRRSRAQMAAFDWSGDPDPVLDHLAIFGPATTDITE